MDLNGFNSKAIHAGLQNNKGQYGSLRMPVYDSAAFEYSSAEEIEKAFLGEIETHSYSRITNPSIAELEEKLKIISNASGALCVSSGMAAIANAVIALCNAGDNIITTRYLFGNTVSLFNKTLSPLGINFKYVDLENTGEIEKNIDNQTRALFLENITNPHLKIFDVESISKIAIKNNILLIVDNTLLTPYLFKSSDYNVDIEILSNTKSISGGATSVGGTILTYKSNKWEYNPKLKNDYEKFKDLALIKRLKKEIYRNLGTCLSPHNAYLQILGLETLSLRLDKSSDNACKVAEYLKENSKVKDVNYPGLKDNKNYSLVKKQFNGKSGGLIIFELKDKKQCFSFMNKLKMIKRATNFCDNKSLIIHPYSTIFCEFNDEEKALLGINERMLRLSVGIEDAGDIIEDINKALE